MPPSFRFHRSTPSGVGGVALFELYGDAESALRRAFVPLRAGSEPLPARGRSRLGTLVDGRGEPIDEVLVTRVPADGQWCGLEAWTIAVHGGTWIQAAAAACLEQYGGATIDRRGVLLRSIEAGALDAIRAAAFEALLEASTERAAEFLSAQWTGRLSRELTEILALAERSDGRMEGARRLRALLDASRLGRRLASPLRLLIAGPPNAGKSTLFNALAERERTLVTDRIGTTRDLVRERIAIEDVPVDIIDSAGVHDAPGDDVEREAIQRATSAEVDAVLWLEPAPWSTPDRPALERAIGRPFLCVASCADRSEAPPPSGFEVAVAALRGDGLDELRRVIGAHWLGLDRDDPAATPEAAPFKPVAGRVFGSGDRRLGGGDEAHP